MYDVRKEVHVRWWVSCYIYAEHGRHIILHYLEKRKNKKNIIGILKIKIQLFLPISNVLKQ